jgi:transposase-like protein
MSTICNHCGSSNYINHGKYQGVQRYKCRDCKRYFSDKVKKFTYQDRMKAMDMYLNNVGIRKTARFMKASPTLILRWVKMMGQSLSANLKKASEEIKDNLPDIIEMDEIYTFVKKNKIEQSYGLLILGNKVVLLRMLSGTKV